MLHFLLNKLSHINNLGEKILAWIPTYLPEALVPSIRGGGEHLCGIFYYPDQYLLLIKVVNHV